MLVKLAFLLFWFARALASNEPKSLAANQNWNTPHDWPLKKIHCLTDQSGCKEIQIQFVVLWGLRTSISALLRRRTKKNRNKITGIEFLKLFKTLTAPLVKRYMVFFTERFLARLSVESYGRWENRPWNNEDTLWWST